MTVIDVSNPNSLSLVTNISTGTDGAPYGLFVQGRYAYVANRVGNTLQVIDLGSAYVQQLEAGGLETGTLATRSNAAIGNDLDVRGGAVIGNGLQVTGDSAFDGKVTITSTLQLPTPAAAASTDTLLAINGSGNVTQTSTLVSQVLPFADATSSNVVNKLVMRDGSGNFAAGTLIATQIGVGTSAPFAPLTVAGSTALAGSVGTGVAPYSVYVQGRYAYVASQDAKLSIVDVSNPGSPAVVGTVTIGGTNPTSISVYVQGRYAYVANYGNNTLSIVDVSNPSSPLVVDTVATGGGTRPISVYVQGRYAYVANNGNNTLSIFDVSNSSNPAVMSTIGTGGSLPVSVYVQGRYAYVGTSGSGGRLLSIIDVSNPSSPAVMSTIAVSGLNSVFIQGRYAYVANAGTLLSIIDVSNPSSPVVAGTAPVLGVGQSVYVQGRYAYVGDDFNNRLSIIDVSNPSNPVVVGFIPTGGSGQRSVYVQGRYAYIANAFSNTLSIIDLGGAYVQQLEAGGIEVGTLATRENVAIGNDLDVKGGMGVASNLNVQGQVTAMNASGASGTAVTSPLCLINISAGGASDPILAADSTGNVTQLPLASIFATATSSNVPNTLVKRDNSGNFLVSALTLNAGSTGALALNFSGSAGTGIYSPAANQVALAVKNSQKLVANSTGVGIGTSAPFTQLAVMNTNALITGTSGAGLYLTSVYLQGRYAYITDFYANLFRVFDVSNPSAPFEVGSVGVTSPQSVVVQGRYAYIGQGYGGNFLLIYDVSNPSKPVQVGSVGTDSNPYNVYVQGRYAYVANVLGNSAQIFDVSNPTAPALAATIPLPGANPPALFVQGRYLYVTGNSTNKLYTIDVSNPTAPVIVSSFDTGANSSPWTVYVQGRYAYVAYSGSLQRLQIIDISDPSNPVAKGSASTLTASRILTVQGRYAYVPDTGGNDMEIFDVSDPNNPIRVGIASVGAGGMAFVQGRYAYVAKYFGGGLAVVDLGGSYIQQLEAGGLETGTLATRENAAIGNDLDVRGGAVFGRGFQATGGSSVLGDLVVTNTNLTMRGTTGTGTSPKYCYVQGRYLYSVGLTTMNIIDVSNPDAPAQVGSLGGFGDAYAIHVQGRYAYVADFGAVNGLRIVDISNPSSPVLVGSSAPTSPHGVYVQGRYAYAVDFSQTLSIIDVSNPASPLVVGTLGGLGTQLLGVFVQGRYAYVINYNGGTMTVVDVSNPTSPTSVATLGGLTNPYSIYVQGRYAYVANLGNSTMSIIDIKNPTSPSIVGTQNDLSGVRSVYVQGRYAYAACAATSSLAIVDVSNPTAPLIAGISTNGNGLRSVHVQGRYAYVVNGNSNNVQVVDLGGAYIQQLEAGGIEAGTFATRSNAAIGNDLDVKGGVAVGRNLNVQGQITAINATGSGTGTAGTAPLRLVNVPSGTFGTQLGVDANGNVGVYSSSARFKENITPLTTESDLLYSLTPVKYDFKPEYGGNKGMYGFIAEDVAKVYPTIINYDNEGRISSYIESTLHALSIKEVQKQQQALAAQRSSGDSHAVTLGMLLHSNNSLQTAINLHDAELDSNERTIQALLITIASMQAHINGLEKRE
jgi:hypothetical protein